MYRHTFHLVSGEEIVAYSKSEEIPTYNYGDIHTFVSEKEKFRISIPVLSILYVETEEMEEG